MPNRSFGVDVGKVGATGELAEFRKALEEAARDLEDVFELIPKLPAAVISRAEQQASAIGESQAEKAAAALVAIEAPGRKNVGKRYGVRLRNTTEVPYALGAEFGANHDVPRETKRGTVLGWNNLPERAANEHRGWFLQPAADALLDDDAALDTLVGPAVDELLSRAFPD